MKKFGAFDVVGDIAILPYKTKNARKVASNILKYHKNIKTIVLRTGLHKGKYRTKEVKFVGGKKNTETLYVENGVLMKLDVEKCYFSSRLGNERLIVSKKVKKGESVLVMFSGVGPYVLLIAKKAKEVYGVEVNGVAHKYAEENVKLNKLDNVKLFKGDVSKVLLNIRKRFDRIVMPLPKDAEKYLKLALSKLKKKGVIHFYDFQKREDINKSVEKVKKYCKSCKILEVRKCGMYAPGKYRVCVDFQKI